MNDVDIFCDELEKLGVFKEPSPIQAGGYLALAKGLEEDVLELEKEKDFVRVYRKYKDCKNEVKAIIVNIDNQIKELECKINYFRNTGKRLKEKQTAEENEENQSFLQD